MSITMAELLEMPDLRTEIFAGESGLGRPVSWAHVCELPDPTEYLASGELLMTVGYTVPEGHEAQVAYMERLADAGLSGLLIADKMHAPTLSGEMAEAADRLSLPVLLTAYDVPFTAISRAVAEANRGDEHARLVQAVKVYETARLAVSESSFGTSLMVRLGEVTRCELYVLDPERGRSLLPEVPGAPGRVTEALTQEVRSRSQPMPAVLRLRTGSRRVLALHVPASRPAVLVAVASGDATPDLSVLRHVATVAALEVEKRVAESERRRRRGAELLAGLVDGRIPTETASHLLSERGLAQEPRLLATYAGEGGKGEDADLHLRLEDRGIPHLLLRRTLLTALLPATTEAIDAFREEVADSYPIGLSDPLGNTVRAPDAYREARWALESAEASGEYLARYGDGTFSPFLPRSLSESGRAVEQVLGPVLDYDASQGSELILSLASFLAQDRSWQRAAKGLHIHKQTLVYRMRRVEELTGRRLSRTEDVAELWFALKTAEASGVLNMNLERSGR
ncbi:MAG: PucR family transcriptional regulator [Actinomycetota bacterium]|jgi:purine catabolism regulator|nr:PucR family transcriptional regulator [Actinomycetota bacterium]